jgi:hypothetical protein
MRKAFALGALLLAPRAEAEWGDQRYGLATGAFVFPSSPAGRGYALVVGITGTSGIEQGWEVMGRLQLWVTQDTPSPRRLWGADLTLLGVRYLFTEKGLRPFAGVELGAAVFPSARLPLWAETNAVLGLEPFVSGAWSVGARVQGGALMRWREREPYAGAQLTLSRAF